MEKQEAFNVISQICTAYKGTLSEHNLIQTALRVLTPEPVKLEKEVDKDSKSK